MPLTRIATGFMVAATSLICTYSLVGQTEPRADCLSYDPSKVMLEGTFVSKTFAGPPRYKSIKNGDKPEKHYVLELQKAVCLNEDKTKPTWNPAQTKVLEIELLLEGEQLVEYKPLLGRDVVATGELSAVASHPVAPVYLVVDRLTAKSEAERLTRFLQNYVGTPTEETKTTQYAAAFVDLKGGGTKDVVVYLSSGGWCGTGGCTMLILAPEGTSYRVITKVPAVRLPIWLLATKSNGWYDIGVVARKNGTEPLYEAILSFDGKSYRSSVSEGDETELFDEKAPRRMVMPATAKDEPLYQ